MAYLMSQIEAGSLRRFALSKENMRDLPVPQREGVDGRGDVGQAVDANSFRFAQLNEIRQRLGAEPPEVAQQRRRDSRGFTRHVGHSDVGQAKALGNPQVYLNAEAARRYSGRALPLRCRSPRTKTDGFRIEFDAWTALEKTVGEPKSFRQLGSHTGGSADGFIPVDGSIGQPQPACELRLTESSAHSGGLNAQRIEKLSVRRCL